MTPGAKLISLTRSPRRPGICRYTHEPYNQVQDRFLSWMEEVQTSGARLAIVEVGCGYNTPTVTRWPMEAIARATAGAALIRINPEAAEVPADVVGASVETGNDILDSILGITRQMTGSCERDANACARLRQKGTEAQERLRFDLQPDGGSASTHTSGSNWRRYLRQLR